MSVKFPDILKHENSEKYAIVDANDIRGLYTVSSLSDIPNIPFDKRKCGGIVSVKGGTIYAYSSEDVSDLKWNDSNNWKLISGNSGNAIDNYVTRCGGLDLLRDLKDTCVYCSETNQIYQYFSGGYKEDNSENPPYIINTNEVKYYGEGEEATPYHPQYVSLFYLNSSYYTEGEGIIITETNQINADFNAVARKSDLDDVVELIPSEASDSNKLADKEFVTNAVIGINDYISSLPTMNTPFDGYSEYSTAPTRLELGPWYKNGVSENININVGDWAVVLADETVCWFNDGNFKYERFKDGGLSSLGFVVLSGGIAVAGTKGVNACIEINGTVKSYIYPEFVGENVYICFLDNSEGLDVIWKIHDLANTNGSVHKYINGVEQEDTYDLNLPTTRYICSGHTETSPSMPIWALLYIINEQKFTQEQWSAINSTVTKDWKDGVDESLSEKQDTLVPGNNIIINGNVISTEAGTSTDDEVVTNALSAAAFHIGLHGNSQWIAIQPYETISSPKYIYTPILTFFPNSDSTKGCIEFEFDSISSTYNNITFSIQCKLDVYGTDVQATYLRKYVDYSDSSRQGEFIDICYKAAGNYVTIYVCYLINSSYAKESIRGMCKCTSSQYKNDTNSFYILYDAKRGEVGDVSDANILNSILNPNYDGYSALIQYVLPFKNKSNSVVKLPGYGTGLIACTSSDTIDFSYRAFNLSCDLTPTEDSINLVTSGGVKSYVDSGLSGKQSTLTTAQLNAVNSGITSTKVSTYDGYATGKQNTLIEGSNIDIHNDTIGVVEYPTFCTEVIENTETVNGLTIGIQGTSADAARHILGSSWRMPTLDEWIELTNTCTMTWTTVEGINGYLVSNNGNSIFLPASGYREKTSTYSIGTEGHYWTGDAGGGEIAAFGAFDATNPKNSGYLVRPYGRSIRPVSNTEGVDLGLSVKWASVNLGATNPQDYGDYFAWGEIEAKPNCTYGNYICPIGSYGTENDPITHVTKTTSTTLWHMNNDDVHVTPENKITWNEKQDANLVVEIYDETSEGDAIVNIEFSKFDTTKLVSLLADTTLTIDVTDVVEGQASDVDLVLFNASANSIVVVLPTTDANTTVINNTGASLVIEVGVYQNIIMKSIKSENYNLLTINGGVFITDATLITNYITNLS